jgi:DNA-binding GntR family transcriptional regulator
VSPQLVTDLYEIRALLEPLAVRQAVPHLDGDARSKLRSAVADCSRALAEFDIPEMGRANWIFHAVLIEHASNPQLRRILQAIEDQFRSFTTVIWLGREVRAREHQDHEAILAAIENGQDPSVVGNLMADHLLRFKQAVVDAVAASASGDGVPFGSSPARSSHDR